MSSISDNFTDANNTNLENHTGTGGSFTWARVNGAAADMKIQSNAAKGSTGVSTVFSSWRAESDLATDQHEASVDVGNLPGGGDRYLIGVALRYSGAANTCYLVLARVNSSTLELWKVSAGTPNQLTTHTVTMSSPFTLRAVIGGTSTASFAVYLNGALEWSPTDASSPITGNTRCGIGYYSPDNAQPTLDNWAAQDSSSGTPYTQSLAGSCTPAGALTKAVTKALAGSITPAGALAKAASKPLAGSATGAGALAKAVAKPLAGSTTPTGALAAIRAFLQSLAGSVTGAGSTTKAVSKNAAGSASGSGACAKGASKPLTGSSTAGGATSKAPAKSLAGSVTPAGAISRVKAAILSLAGAVTGAGLLRRAIAKLFGGSSAPSGDASSQFTPGGPLTACTLSATPHATSVDLSVTAATGGVPPRTYFFQRRGTFIPPSAFTWDDIASGIDLLAFTDAGRLPETTYHYRVVIVDDASSLVTSNVVDVTTLAAEVSDHILGEVSIRPAIGGAVSVRPAIGGEVMLR